MACVTSVKFFVYAIGEKRTEFTLSCGLRQGDPLSLYLFLLVADVLSNLLTHRLNSNSISGLKIRRTCLTLSHLFFADDAILFFKAKTFECESILEVLKVYSDASGQLLNFDKSGALFSANSSTSLSNSICHLLGVTKANPKAQYLGLLTSWGKSKSEAYRFLLEKELAKMQLWKSKLLSQAGREILIKSVVQAIPTYAMAYFDLPKAFQSKFNTLIRNFWWKGNPDSRGIHWANWNHMTKPKVIERMGFRDFEEFNQACLQNRAGDFSHTLIRFCLLKGRALLQEGTRWQIQSGKQVYFWEDRWIPSFVGHKIASPKPIDCNIISVADIIDPTFKTWNLDALGDTISDEERVAIQAIPIAVEDRDNSRIWHHTKSGIYLVKSGYALARTINGKSSVHDPSSSTTTVDILWKSMWQIDTPSKIRHFWWRACNNALVTKAGLYKRKCSASMLCPICQSEIEIVEHLLFDCPWTKAVWSAQTCNNATSQQSRYHRLSQNSVPPLESTSPEPSSAWSPAAHGCFKINCDAAFCQRTSKAAVAAIIRDSNGHFINGNARTLGASSAILTEALAVRMACLMIQAHKLSNVEIESDSQLVIQLCVSETVPPWEISVVILDIRALALQFHLSFTWTRHSNNKVAHWVAKTQASNSLPDIWNVYLPSSFVTLLFSDVT
ncbi:uncharacterized protein LOC114309966 [Camellia sinensis]|uniref:uncharacterized protein LOC114309966 n=1 Tax=Camellia sinensis TaxID=4442 RepID=UPI001036D9D0|nr:uncharacterized protein LOC114309966 [Camellia sinensis]